MDSLLWLKVERDFSDAMRRDRLSTEQLIKTWMRGWRTERGRKAVTVTVEGQDVVIAEGTTSFRRGDEVTIP